MRRGRRSVRVHDAWSCYRVAAAAVVDGFLTTEDEEANKEEDRQRSVISLLSWDRAKVSLCVREREGKEGGEERQVSCEQEGRINFSTTSKYSHFGQFQVSVVQTTVQTENKTVRQKGRVGTATVG